MIEYPLDLRDEDGNPLDPESLTEGQIVTTGLKSVDPVTRQCTDALRKFVVTRPGKLEPLKTFGEVYRK